MEYKELRQAYEKLLAALHDTHGFPVGKIDAPAENWSGMKTEHIRALQDIAVYLGIIE